MTLDVSGGEFATAFHRLQFVARELPPTDDIRLDDAEFLAAEVILAMRRAQRNGWNLGAAIVNLLRRRSGA